MVESAREKIKHKLLAESENFWKKFDSYEVVERDNRKGFIAVQKVENNGNTIAMSKYRV